MNKRQYKALLAEVDKKDLHIDPVYLAGAQSLCSSCGHPVNRHSFSSSMCFVASRGNRCICTLKKCEVVRLDREAYLNEVKGRRQTLYKEYKYGIKNDRSSKQATT